MVDIIPKKSSHFKAAFQEYFDLASWKGILIHLIDVFSVVGMGTSLNYVGS